MGRRFTYSSMLLLLVLLISGTVNAQTINLRGKVSNQIGKPIANAIISLVGQKVKDTTSADGSYSIASTAISAPPLLKPNTTNITMYKDFLDFSLQKAAPVKIDIFDVKGKLLKKVVMQNAQTGFYRFNLAENSRAEKLLIVRAAIGKEYLTFRYFPLSSSASIVTSTFASTEHNGNNLAKITAIDDTLKATATGYTAKAVAINNYDQQLNITLDTIGGNGARPSAGCGKAKTMADSVVGTIKIGNTNRSYILNIPKDYDPNHPYALWFAIHGRSGTALGVARGSAGTNYGYFGMRKLANKDKSTTIFCAPDGIGTMWASGDGDIQFFRTMIKNFENDLCIDQSRIFAAGFSMGGSMSYALACAMPDTFKAIAMHSGGGMSGCVRPSGNPGKMPIFITHGDPDGTNVWPNFGFPQIKDLAERDGCDPLDIPNLVKQNPPKDDMHPVCFEYKNCDPGFPCKAYIFKGGHTPSPGPVKGNDWGEASTWVPDSTWNYFKQFY